MFPGTFANRRKHVSLFAGWDFIRFHEGDLECMPVMANFSFDGPIIEYDATRISLDDLENPSKALMWLPLCLHDLCTRVLAEAVVDSANHTGKLQGRGWDEFRTAVVRWTGSTMEELVNGAVGGDFYTTVGFMTESLYYESGIDSHINARHTGGAFLRTASA